MHIMFVCTGNTCRSPMAEGLLRKRLAERGREDIEVSSAGIGAGSGNPAADGAYLVALEDGVDLSGHQSRRLTRDMVDSADFILVMSNEHIEVIQEMGGWNAYLLGEFLRRPEDEAEVDDPYGGDMEMYRRTWAVLSRLIADLAVLLDLKPPESSDDRG